MANKDIYLNVSGRRKDVWIGLNERNKEIVFSIEGGRNGYAKAIIDTTVNWNSDLSYIPEKGLIVVYSDKGNTVADGEIINIPGIKIGDGNAYLVDLPFVGDDLYEILEEHIQNTAIHVTSAEKIYWNNKLNCEYDVNEELLILNRD